MMDARDLWRQLLDVEDPWSVVNFESDKVRRCYDVTIGLETTKGWFGKASKTHSSGLEKIWRHINFGEWDITIHVVAPSGSNLASVPWAGQPGLPFTHALCEAIFALLRDGLTAKAVANQLRLSEDELWRFQYAMDNGHWSPPMSYRANFSGLVDADIPPAADPVWQALVDGSRDIDIQLLSLKLILARLRSQVAAESNDDVCLAKAQELFTYFVRNKRSLEYEIAQLLENR